jgi:cation-transporting P-type ATPase 13A2
MSDNKRRLLSKDEKMEVTWMTHTDTNLSLYILFCILSFGTLYIWCLISPSWKEWFLSSSCSPEEADSVSTTIDKVLKVVPIARSTIDGRLILSIEVNCKRYYTSEAEGWDFLSVPDVPINFSHYLKPTVSPSSVTPSLGPLAASRDTLIALYGTNKMELPKASFWDILAVTIFHPFYLFQYFAVIVWMIEDYVLYSCVILLTTGGAIYATASETMFNLRRLHDLAGATSMVTLVKQSGERVEISDRDLVPGDQFVIRYGTSLPCDAVLISGRVSVDESMLTGESVPMNKTPIELSVFQDGTVSEEMILSKLPGNVLYSGTKVLLTSGVGEEASESDCVAVVYRTGFRSAKGQLIATLLHPKENFMSFFSDALWVILFMAVLCTSLYIWSAVYLRQHEASWGDIFLKYLDAITIAVPPALTASLTVATGISINRLRHKDIYVSESTRVNW